MDDQLDYAIALSLQQTFDNEAKLEESEYEKVQKDWSGKSWDPKSIVDNKLEMTDPNPNIHDLFVQYDAMFFWGKLVSSGVAVRWSPRMTLSAGVCAYEGRGGLCSIRLSQPLLKLRPRKDLVQTLLHEMIHAYLFVTENYRDHDGHGPKFLYHMHRINKMTGANITVYHNFHDEVREYRQHWWKCNGPCQFRPPYFGLVKRAMNRAPSPRDPWWSQHQSSCGGTYQKIKEPENYGKKRTSKQPKKERDDKRPDNVMDIREMFKKKGSKSAESTDSQLEEKVYKKSVDSDVKPFKGAGHRLDGFSSESTTKDKDGRELSLHDKMLMAAEKRQNEARQRGRSQTSEVASKKQQQSEDTSPSSASSNKQTKSYIKGSRPHSPDDSEALPAAKKLKLNTSDSIIVLDSDTPDRTAKSVVKFLKSHTSATTHQSAEVIDLSDSAGPGPLSAVTVDSRATKSIKTEVISIDDSSPDHSESVAGVEVMDDFARVESGSRSPSLSPGPDDLRTCPVCGMSNIPKAIINAHTVFCLDADEESQLVDVDNF